MGLKIRLDRTEEIGVGRRATTDELAELDEHGFVIVPALLADEEVDLLRTEFERLVAEDPQSKLHERGTRRAKVTSDNDVFAVCWRNRVVLDAAAHIHGSTFEIGNVDVRNPNPGVGEQRLHPDLGATPVPGVTASWSSTPSLPTTVQPGSCRAHIARVRPQVRRYRSPAPRFRPGRSRCGRRSRIAVTARRATLPRCRP